jgi:hypothetical protein
MKKTPGFLQYAASFCRWRRSFFLPEAGTGLEMKRRAHGRSRIALTLALAASVSLLVFGGPQVHEHVEVVYQEVLVRVFDGARPVPGLTAEDFTLSEDGKEVKVSYCRQMRRSMALPEAAAAATSVATSRPRLFLFMLWFDEESREWPAAWEYFLGHVYRAGDRIILSDGTQAIEVASPDKDKERISSFFAGMAEGLRRKQAAKKQLVAELESAASEFYDSLVFNPFGVKAEHPSTDGSGPPPVGLEADMEKGNLDQFKKRYQAAIDEYRLVRLKGYRGWLERLAGELKAVEAEKWVLVFLQNERLPLLDRSGRLFRDTPMKLSTASELRSMMDKSERQLELDSDLTSYFRDLQPQFIGANATTDLFLCDAAKESLANEHLRWRQVFSSWEGAFRQISADSGGRVSDSTRLAEAVKKAAASEDIYYVLSYLPAEGKDRRRELSLSVRRPGLKAVYSRRLTVREIFPLNIRDVQWQDGKLKISLADFQRIYGDAGLSGSLRISVRAEVQGGAPLAAESNVHPFEPAVDVVMGLRFPTSGRYRVHVDVEDRLSGRRAQADKEIEVIPPPPSPAAALAEEPLSPELKALLDRAADYCRRLKEGAFRFYCLEKVEEKYLERNPVKQLVEVKERRWEYDYQITGANGQINERRRLIRDGTRKVDKEDAFLETRFASRYSVFLPVTLLAAENRATYSYRLLERDRVKKRRCSVVEVLPRQEGGGGIAQGKVWIDEEDGSVLKIEMNPRGVAGVEELERAAKNLLARLLLEVTHLYEVERDGLRFPSMAMFREAYIFEKTVSTQKAEIPFAQGEGKNPGSSSTVVEIPRIEQARREVEFYRLRQDYKKYRFFDVKMREEVKNPLT